MDRDRDTNGQGHKWTGTHVDRDACRQGHRRTGTGIQTDRDSDTDWQSDGQRHRQTGRRKGAPMDRLRDRDRYRIEGGQGQG
jgi:hypothetical protein